MAKKIQHNTLTTKRITPLKAIMLSALVLSTSALAEVVTEPLVLPDLAQEKQHSISAKRISDYFTRAHYKKIKIDDELSIQVFERYLETLDGSKHFFLQSDIDAFQKYSLLAYKNLK